MALGSETINSPSYPMTFRRYCVKSSPAGPAPHINTERIGRSPPKAYRAEARIVISQECVTQASGSVSAASSGERSLSILTALIAGTATKSASAPATR